MGQCTISGTQGVKLLDGRALRPYSLAMNEAGADSSATQVLVVLWSRACATCAPLRVQGQQGSKASCCVHCSSILRMLRVVLTRTVPSAHIKTVDETQTFMPENAVFVLTRACTMVCGTVLHARLRLQG